MSDVTRLSGGRDRIDLNFVEVNLTSERGMKFDIRMLVAKI